MPKRSLKRPRDPNQLAKLIVDIATGERGDSTTRKSQHVPVRNKRRTKTKAHQ